MQLAVHGTLAQSVQTGVVVVLVHPLVQTGVVVVQLTVHAGVWPQFVVQTGVVDVQLFEQLAVVAGVLDVVLPVAVLGVEDVVPLAATEVVDDVVPLVVAVESVAMAPGTNTMSPTIDARSAIERFTFPLPIP